MKSLRALMIAALSPCCANTPAVPAANNAPAPAIKTPVSRNFFISFPLELARTADDRLADFPADSRLRESVYRNVSGLRHRSEKAELQFRFLAHPVLVPGRRPHKL